MLPTVFISHGSPMLAIEPGPYGNAWRKMANDLPRPKAMLVVSAHWNTRQPSLTLADKPDTIHDFGGFPQELFDVQYNAPGNPELAKQTAALVHSTHVELDHDWGLDHGTWTVVRHM